MNNYAVQIEVAGPLAMFTRPDTGGTPTSYAVPTWSACKGIFEAVAMLADGGAWVCPTMVEVCKRRGAVGGTVRFQRYTTNYRGPLRKASLIRGGSGMQLFATVLVHVCYRLHAEIRGDEHGTKHHLQDLFNRRLEQGRCYRTPALGWREFTCSYWGPFREEYEVDRDLSLTVPSILETVWGAPRSGRYAPRFAPGVTVQRGVLKFAE